MLDPSGVRRATQGPLGAFAFVLTSTAAQLPQTSYMSLQTPYSYIGLGRTNNYIESLFIGSTRHQPRHFAVIEGVIPNSQVVILPWQPPGGTDPGTWSRRLYLHPGDWSASNRLPDLI